MTEEIKVVEQVTENANELAKSFNCKQLAKNGGIAVVAGAATYLVTKYVLVPVGKKCVKFFKKDAEEEIVDVEDVIETTEESDEI